MDSSYSVVIVEDDIFSRRIVRLIINNHFPELNVTGEFASITDASLMIPQLAPDLMILDIQLEDGNAFDLLKQLREQNIEPKIVFMSAIHSYIEEAVQFASVDFLKKPFDESELVMALDKAIDSINDSDYGQRLNTLFSNLHNNNGDKSIIFKQDNGHVNAPLSTIVYGRAVPGGAEFRLVSGEDFFVAAPLRRYELLLSNHGFFRCHPTYVINLRLINTIDENNGSVSFNSGHIVPFEAWRLAGMLQKYRKYCEKEFVRKDEYQ